jgi:hypothetical protein
MVSPFFSDPSRSHYPRPDQLDPSKRAKAVDERNARRLGCSGLNAFFAIHSPFQQDSCGNSVVS